MARKSSRKSGSNNDPGVELTGQVADMVCGILHTIYVTDPESFRERAESEDFPVESQAAAAITSQLRKLGALGGIPDPAKIPAGSKNPHHRFEPIPEIPAELVLPINTLVRAASFFHKNTVDILAEHPEAEIPEDFRETYSVCESILAQWLDHSGITMEGLMDDDGE